MAKNNAVNLDITNESDGVTLQGGVVARFLKWLGANITITGSGSNTYTFPSATDTLVGRTSTDTLTNKTLTEPRINTSINDANGNEIIKTPATTSAVNEVTITNAATGGAPEVSATGGDTNINLKLSPKGTGFINPKFNGARAYKSSAQNTGGVGSSTKVALQTESYDINSNFDSTTNYRYTVPTGGAGYYQINARLLLLTGTASQVDHKLVIKKNGSTTIIEGTNVINTTYPALFLIDTINLADGDYVELFINGGGGAAAVAIETGASSCYMTVQRVGY